MQVRYQAALRPDETRIIAEPFRFLPCLQRSDAQNVDSLKIANRYHPTRCQPSRALRGNIAAYQHRKPAMPEPAKQQQQLQRAADLIA